MWHTPDGDRKLEGAERRLFVLGVLRYLDYFDMVRETADDFHAYDLDAEVLNAYLPQDIPYLFLQVADNLLGPGPTPKLVAWNEAIVWEVFEQIKSSIEMEMEILPENTAATYNRQAVVDAVTDDPPKVSETDIDVWDLEVNALGDRILFDEDFLLYSMWADENPSRVAYLKDIMGIDPDYFATSPPILTEAERKRLDLFRSSLRGESSTWYYHHEKTGRLVEGGA